MQKGFKVASRLLAVTFILFISLFALDSFEQGRPFLQNLLAFVIHLIPVYILAIITFLSWRWPLIGGWFFWLLAIVYLSFFTPIPSWQLFLVIPGSLFIIGLLFLLQKFLPKGKNKK